MIPIAYSRIYFRNFILFTALFIVVFVPFIYLISSQFSKYAMVEINRNDLAKVNDISYNMDFLLDKLNRYAMSMYDDQNIQNWMFSEREDQIRTIVAMKTQSNYSFNEPFIAQSYIINNITDRVLDSKWGESSLAAFKDQPLLERVNQITSESDLLFDHKLNGMEYLALLVPYSPVKKNYGYLVLLIDKNMIMNYLFGPNRKEGQEVTIFTPDHQRVFGAASPAFDRAIHETFSGVSGKGRFAQIEGERWFVQKADLKSSGWHVYYANNYRYITGHIQNFKEQLLLYSVFALSVISILFFWLSWRSLRPLSKLADKLKGKYAQPPENKVNMLRALTRSEINMIDRGLDVMLQNVEKLHSSIRDHQDLIRSEQLGQWLFQGKLKESAREFLLKETKLLQSESLCLAVVRIDAYQAFCERYDFNSRQLFKYAMRNISEEIFIDQGISIESLDSGSDHVVLFVSGTEASMEQRLRLLASIQAHILSVTKIPVSVAVSNTFSLHQDLRVLYEHTYELTMLKFLKGETLVFTEDDYEEFSETLPTSENHTHDLILSVQQGNADNAIAQLRQRMNLYSSLSSAECKLHLTLLIYELMKSFNKLNAIQRIDGINKVLSRFSTLREVQEWMESMIHSIISDISAPKTSLRKEEVVKEIVEYIRCHLQDPQLCIESISDHLSYSVSYLRQAFKEITKTTIADYILEKKVQMVKELLVSTELTITEIMDNSGFLTKSHFFSAFKKVTGLTPKQYRESAQA